MYYVVCIILFILYCLYCTIYIVCVVCIVCILLYYIIILLYYIIPFLLKGEFEKYWRGLSHPESQDPPTQILGICAGRTRNGGKSRVTYYCEARRSPTRHESGRGLTLTLPTPTKSIVGSSGALWAVYKRSRTRESPLLRGKGGYNGYYVHVSA